MNAQSIISGFFGIVRRNDIRGDGHGKRDKDEIVLKRNRSARYSPNNINNGFLVTVLFNSHESLL